MMASLPAKHLLNTHPVAAGDYFGKSKVLDFVSKEILNALHINRHRGGTGPKPLETLDKHLKSGKSLLLFPEGSRGEPGVMTDFKSGIAVLLKKNPGLPFIPVYLVGFGRVMPKDKTLIIPLNCKVRYGGAIVPDPSKSIDEILELTQEAVLALRKSDEREYDKFAYD
jgi:1-acyl-sn-glycerol-3-phosphate acyltransferase